MSDRFTNPTVQVNNDAVAITPNTWDGDEGLGEQTIETASLGGGRVQQIYSDNVETAFGSFKFSLPATPPNIALVKSWKVKRNTNTVIVTGSNASGTVRRSYSQAAILNNYKVPASTDGKIDLEWGANAPI